MNTAPQPPFATRLLEWWDQHGRNDLPWQHPRTPYRVWVSEIMLQQTQVSTVIPYFLDWMERFPDVAALAKAPLDDVLGHWSGLGYYARARNLHRAAQVCVERHGAAFPATAAEWTALPGIGLSTANAIISQATDRPAAVLDGNVRRVLARHAMVAGWTGAGAVQQRLWQQAEERLPSGRGADYTQAIMDLGALICSRNRPDCNACPVAADCRACQAGATAQYPAARPRIRVGARSLGLLIITDRQQRVLLEKRPPAGIWGGLWCLPEFDRHDTGAVAAGFAVGPASPLPVLEHRLTHLKLSIHPFLVRNARAEEVNCSSQHAWFPLAGRPRLGLPKPVADLLRQLVNEQPEGDTE